MGTPLYETGSAFTSLPAELLNLFIDQRYTNESQTWWGDVVDFETLKALRLACRQYAYLPRLLEKVFKSIRLEAAPDQVQLAETLDLSWIKPHVKAITMTPSKYSWAMTEDKFQHIVSIPRIEEICQEVGTKWYRVKNAGGDVTGLPMSGKEEIDRVGWRSFVEKHTDGKMPFSATEMATGYERYMQHAQRTREMFETKQLHRAWTKVLTQLPNVHSFKIGIWEFDGRCEENWKDSGCEIHIHAHNHNTPGHETSTCRQLQEPVGEALFRAVIASLVTARSNLVQLEIRCIFDSNFVWADDGTLDDLDLSSLLTLSFDPVEAEAQELREWSSERKATAIARCGLALATLLHKCSFNLRKLLLYPDHTSGYLDWPPAAPNRIPILPALESFTASMDLDLPAFAHFLLQSPTLKFLRLNCCGGSLGQWRELWDAIRDHPSRMTLEFDQLPCNSYTECSVYHHTGEASKAPFDDDPWENIEYSLDNYLSGRRHWDRTLRMWFEDGDGEPTDSEDEEDDDDDDDDADEAAVSESELSEN